MIRRSWRALVCELLGEQFLDAVGLVVGDRIEQEIDLREVVRGDDARLIDPFTVRLPRECVFERGVLFAVGTLTDSTEPEGAGKNTPGGNCRGDLDENDREEP